MAALTAATTGPASACRRPAPACRAATAPRPRAEGIAQRAFGQSRKHGLQDPGRAARPADADGGADRRHGQPSFSVPPTSASVPGCDAPRPRRRDRPASLRPSRKHGLQDHEGHGQRDEHAQGGHGGGRQDEYALHDCSVVVHGYPHPHSMQGSTELRHPTMPLKRGGAGTAGPQPRPKRVALRGNTYWPKMRARARTSARRAGRALGLGQQRQVLEQGALGRHVRRADHWRPPRRAGRTCRRTCAPRRAGARS